MEKQLLEQLSEEIGRPVNVGERRLVLISDELYYSFVYKEPVSFLDRIGASVFPDVFGNVTDVYIHHTKANQTILDIVGKFPHLKLLNVSESRDADGGLEEFKRQHPEVVLEINLWKHLVPQD